MSAHAFADLLRERAFMRFWSARLASVMGSQMLMVAVGWQMYELTASAWDPVSYTHLTLPTIYSV